jgi:prepilin-type N-terminal cleavage/methylation domain-containing protein
MKIRENKGFTLIETLLTVILVLLMSGAVAAGMSVMSRTIHKIQNKANAEVLLSTTLTLISDDLKNTENVVLTGDESEDGGKTVQFLQISENGADVWIGIENGGSTAGSETGNTGIQKSYYSETVNLETGDHQYNETGISTAYVTDQAKTGTLYTTIGSITYKNHVLTIQDLEVKNTDHVTQEKLDSFSVAALNIN